MAKKDIKSLLVEELKILLQERGIGIYKIVVFGSFATGKDHEFSDVDVIIVSNDFKNKSIFERVRMATGIGRILVRKLKKPVDLIYYSDEEWENKNFLLINEAKSHGEVVYG